MNYIHTIVINAALVLVSITSHASDIPEKWTTATVLVDDLVMTYAHPGNAFFYFQPKEQVLLTGERIIYIARPLYNKPIFARWKPASVDFEFSFWNVMSDIAVNNNEGLYRNFENSNSDGRFSVLRKENFENGDWTYISNQYREGYYKYFRNGYAICVKASFSRRVSPKERAKYSQHLRLAAQTLEFP